MHQDRYGTPGKVVSSPALEYCNEDEQQAVHCDDTSEDNHKVSHRAKPRCDHAVYEGEHG